MIPWLVLGWLQVALVFITLGIFLLALCVSQDIRVHLNVRQAFFMYLAASIYTGMIYYFNLFYKETENIILGHYYYYKTQTCTWISKHYHASNFPLPQI
jgi:ABC-type sugar transport system permease subunit